MSADDGYIIRKHPKGGFALVHYFQSMLELGWPPAGVHMRQHPTVQAAWTESDSDWTEYGVTIHPECWEEAHVSPSPD